MARVPYELWLPWSDGDQRAMASATGLDRLRRTFTESVVSLIQSHSEMHDLMVHKSSYEEHAAKMTLHLNNMVQDPRSADSQYRSHLVGLAHIRAGVLPSWYVHAYNQFFPAAHKTIDADASGLPPIDVLRRRWVWDICVTLDAYQQEIVSQWDRERGQLQSELILARNQAHTDMLTGLPNRRGMETFMERLFPTGGDAGAFAILDLDGFKGVNDRHGHPMGDHVLQVLGEALRRAIRPTDYVGRLGGDEFGLWLPRLVNTEDIVAHLRRVVSQLPLEKWRLGLSAGLARFPDDGTRLADLYRQADTALYAAKKQGKNCLAMTGDARYYSLAP